MQMPNDFNNVQAFTSFETLEPGAHVCVVKKIEECKSSTGKDMVRIYLDTDKSDKQPNFYEKKFKEDTRGTKKWGCIVYQLVLDTKGNTNRGFKTFIDCLEQSNNFKVQWGDAFATSIQGKLIGGVFGREEYQNDYGESKFAVKCFNFRTVQDVKAGMVRAPKDRLLSPSNGFNNFDGITPADDEDMPF